VGPEIAGATISGGGGTDVDGAPRPNQIRASFGTISGGVGNTITSDAPLGTVAGGAFNTAAAPLSFAAGNSAKANNRGAFVWSDSTSGDFPSQADNEFAIRAAGGLRVLSGQGVLLNSADRPLITRGWDPFTSGPYVGIGRWGMFMEPNRLVVGVPAVQDKSFEVATYNADGTRLMRLTVDQAGNLTITGTLSERSDREAKKNFTEIDPREILDGVASLPISRWNYKEDPQTPHLGPVAQDFHAAFVVGPDDKHISNVDANGVALAAIQGLNLRLKERDARITQLEQQNRELVQRLSALEETVRGSISSK